ncbi:MAG: cellulase family glycosylhydrolase, partial [Planctomycetota bacterium]
TNLVDQTGETVILRGVNLGNWLLLEPWMFGWGHPDLPSQHDLLELFTNRFGEDKTTKLLKEWRDNFITEADFERIAAFGMNAVRLPIHYSVIESSKRDGTLDPEGMLYVDFAVDAASKHGLYVVLDLHGAPGGQSVDAPTGRVGHNTLWTDEEAQQRTISLWTALAERYGDHDAIAVYDLLNEPYGAFNTDHEPALAGLMDRLVEAVRSVDANTPIVAAGTLSGIGFYGSPESRGWENAGFTEHFYPGIFGGEPVSLAHQARFDQALIPAKVRELKEQNAWLLVGEFNPIFERVGGARRTKAMIDLFESSSWGTTLWSYCLLKAEGGFQGDNWYMRTNADDWQVSPFTSSYEEILEAFRSVDQITMIEDEELRELLVEDHSPVLPMPKINRPARFIEAGQLPEGFVLHNVGESNVGLYQPLEDGFVIAGGGRDIWGTRDSFTYVSRPAKGNDELSATLARFDAWHQYAKAGLMLRASTDPSSPHLFIHAFPDGRVIVARRDEPKGSTTERVLATVGFPVELGLLRQNGKATVTIHGPGIGPESHDLRLPNSLQGDVQIGYAVLGHTGNEPGVAKFGDTLSISSSHSVVELSHSWNSWGGIDKHSESETRLSLDRSSGIWQELEVEPDKQHRLVVDIATDGALPAGFEGKFELRVEHEDPGKPSQMLTLATREWPLNRLPTTPERAMLHLEFTPSIAHTRLLIGIHPVETPRGDSGWLSIKDPMITADEPIGSIVPEAKP